MLKVCLKASVHIVETVQDRHCYTEW